ncbi:hypothetical protein O3P69_008823 [Scylla paramamosain]|uniref:Uncharacterized protein n=1 Tax=Scylla paramamosain TaxID=85552 RepID=A0AAW0TNM7_SCYPA
MKDSELKDYRSVSLLPVLSKVLETIVQGQVDDKPCCLTGTEHTFLCADTVVAAVDLRSSEQQLCGITGHCTQLKGLVQAKVTIERVNETQPVFVADVENLLGMDYLQETKIVLDFGDMTMGIGNREVPLWEESSNIRLFVAQATRISPHVRSQSPLLS